MARRTVTIDRQVVEHDVLAGEDPVDALSNLLPGDRAQDLAHVAAPNRLGRLAEPAPIGLVGPHIASVGVDVGEQRGNGVDDEAQLTGALPSSLLGARARSVSQDDHAAPVGQTAPVLHDARAAVGAREPLEHLERLSDERARRASQQLRRGAVDLLDPARLIGDDDRDR